MEPRTNGHDTQRIETGRLHHRAVEILRAAIAGGIVLLLTGYVTMGLVGGAGAALAAAFAIFLAPIVVFAGLVGSMTYLERLEPERYEPDERPVAIWRGPPAWSPRL